jgi:hypothetical protein
MYVDPMRHSSARILNNWYSDMSISHNMFIRGINAIYAQAEGIKEEQVKPFTFFCISFVCPPQPL